MFRYRSSQALVIVALCSSLAAAVSLVRYAHAQNTAVVDLEGDTHHNPPASTTDKSTPAPAAATKSDRGTAKATSRVRDAARQEADAKKLKLRAGERVGATPRGKAQAFGMSLQEGANARVKVVEVTMNSPAFDAGVMKGDEIIAFQGFRGESYREWIDGIRRLATDTAAGLKIPVVVARDGKQVTVLIEVQPKAVPRPTGRALVQPGSPLIPPGVGPAMPEAGSQPGPAVVVGTGGNNVVIDGAGPFGDFFGGGQAASPNERAVAHVVRIGGKPSPNPSAATDVAAPIGKKQTITPNSSAGATAAPTTSPPRIGMAGFRDDPEGMVVMVDVGALPAGNYIVGISDPSVIGGAAVTEAAAERPNVPTPPQVALPQGSVPAPAGNGQIVPNEAAPTPANPAGAVQTTGNGGALNQIGTITVDKSGTGRMQQKLESVQVRNVVGQAIVLYTQHASPQNGSTGVPTNQGAADSPSPRGSQGVSDASAGQVSGAAHTTAVQPATAGSQVPVAAGIIQLVTDRRPPANTDPQTTQAPTGANGTVQQPASAATATGQNLVR